VQARSGDRPLGTDGRPRQVLFQVVQLELGRLADQSGGLLRVGHARELDDDLVRPLLAQLGLGHAELVDAVAHDVDGAVEIVGRELVALRRDGLQYDLKSSLEVEAERGAPMEGRLGDGEQRDADEGRSDERHE
jgi:hypothetical protein